MRDDGGPVERLEGVALRLVVLDNRRQRLDGGLLAGAIGFASIILIHNQYLLFVSYFLIGFAWAAMLALPFTLVTNALEGNPYMGSYLGLFNCTICLPQIIAAATGGLVMSLVGGSQAMMLLVAGIFLVAGALCVRFIDTKKQ